MWSFPDYLKILNKDQTQHQAVYASRRLTLGITVNTAKSSMEHHWGRLFCCHRNCDVTSGHWRNTLWQLADKRYRRLCYDTLTLLPPFIKKKLTLFTTTSTNRTPTSSLPKKSKKMENFFFRDCLVSRNSNGLRMTVTVQKTDAYGQITWRIILHWTRLHTKTDETRQLVYDKPDGSRDENKCIERVFLKNSYNAHFIRQNFYRPVSSPVYVLSQRETLEEELGFSSQTTVSGRA